MLPLPLAVHAAPTEAEQVQVTPVNAAGIASVTVAPVTSLGPLFVTVIVYVSAVPGTALVMPSVLVIATSAIRPVFANVHVRLSPGPGVTLKLVPPPLGNVVPEPAFEFMQLIA